VVRAERAMFGSDLPHQVHDTRRGGKALRYCSALQYSACRAHCPVRHVGQGGRRRLRRKHRHLFDSPNLARPDLIALAARVGYRIAKPGETPFPATFPGWVEATLADGRRLVERVDVNVGHPDNPLSDEAVHTKFVDNARDALGSDAALRVAELVAALPRTSAADLAHALRASRTSSSPSPRTMS
jgi:hypothetical protein